MKKNKIGIFTVKPHINKTLTWVLAAYLVLEFLVECGNFVGLAHVSSGWLTYGLSRITQSGVGKVLFMIATTGTLFYIWEWFRRSMKKTSTVLSLVVLALITLMICDVPFSLVPGPSTLAEFQHPGRIHTFAENFLNVSSGVQSILQIIISIAAWISFKGRIRSFGIANLACIFISAVGTGWLYTYLYNASTSPITPAVSFAFVLFRYIMGVIPVIFLRRTMTYKHISETEDQNDIQ